MCSPPTDPDARDPALVRSGRARVLRAARGAGRGRRRSPLLCRRRPGLAAACASAHAPDGHPRRAGQVGGQSGRANSPGRRRRQLFLDTQGVVLAGE